MAFLIYSVSVMVAVIACLDGKLTDNNEEITLTARFLRVDPHTGDHRGLHRQDIEQLGKGENHQLRLHFDNDLPPLDMRLTQGSVWNRDSVVVVRKGPIRMEMPQALDGNCFLRGKLVEADGAVSINRCGIMSGAINTPTHHYQIEEQQFPEGEEEILGYTVFKVTRMVQEQDEMDREHEKNLMDKVNKELAQRNAETHNNGTVRMKRRASYESVTIETVLYLDSNYAMHLYEERGLDTDNKIKNFMIAKWNTIQGVFDDTETIGARVTIAIKLVEIWWDNPASYPDEDVGVSPRLAYFCRNTPETDHFDLKVLYTKGTGGEAMGLAYIGHLCTQDYNCFLAKSPTPAVWVEIHELGHTLGFQHDPDIEGCDEEGGFMGWGRTLRYQPCYRTVLQEQLRSVFVSCLFEKNVNSNGGIHSLAPSTPAATEPPTPAATDPPATTVGTIYYPYC